ncbi:hypothetical protein EGI31_15250 [Lacihabitans soyangensis]|uniref:Uncharacterized protein n=1 Tax=Lacihabitans soyangensis TaxID=869394 RepID=A0AAE3KVL1_9BACT|nr:hypothetical protein [Lacihabitans soyangensis]
MFRNSSFSPSKIVFRFSSFFLRSTIKLKLTPKYIQTAPKTESSINKEVVLPQMAKRLITNTKVAAIARLNLLSGKILLRKYSI